MKKILSSGLAMGAVLVLVGCGGGSSDPKTVTGQFVDTYVEGLNYTCSSGTEGVTNSDGEYTCNEGDTVEFSLGGYILGSTTASAGIVTPDTLYPDNEEAALNVAQVLQTLDVDPDDGIITIPQDFSDLDDVNATPEDTSFDDVIAEVLGEDLVTEEAAQTHMDESQLSITLAGKTFYEIEEDEGVYSINTIQFNSDLTTLTFNSSNGSENLEIHVQGEKLYVGENEYHILAEVTDTYLLIDDYFDGSADGQTKFYLEEADAQAFIDETAVEALVALLSGKTVYTTIYDEMYTLESWTFNDAVTSGTWHEIVGGSESGTGTVTFDGNVMTFTEGSESSTLTFTDTTNPDYLTVDVDGEYTIRLYYDRTKAEAYFNEVNPTNNDLSTLLAGKTLYTTIYDEMYTLESWTFDTDVITGVWQELVGGSDNGSGTVAIEGNVMTFTEGSEISTLTFTDTTNPDYLTVDVDGEYTIRLYYDRTKAETYFNQMSQPETDINTPTEVATNIVGTWDHGCVDYGDIRETGMLTINANGTGTFEGAEYSATDSDCTGTALDSWTGTFTYEIGGQTTGVNGESAVELNLVVTEDGSTENYYTMVHFNSVTEFMMATSNDGDVNDGSTEAKRENLFEAVVYTKQ